MRISTTQVSSGDAQVEKGGNPEEKERNVKTERAVE
jgi:hypothetical protein